MNREYHKWYSHRLNRDMELLVFGHAGAKVLVFPHSLRPVLRVREYGAGPRRCATRSTGAGCSCTVDSIDEESFYRFWNRPWDRVHRHMQYESYLLNEVLPLMWAKNGHPCVIAHGCSFERSMRSTSPFVIRRCFTRWWR